MTSGRDATRAIYCELGLTHYSLVQSQKTLADPNNTGLGTVQMNGCLGLLMVYIFSGIYLVINALQYCHEYN